MRRTRSKVQHARQEAARTDDEVESPQGDRIDISPESLERARTALAGGDDDGSRPKIERLKHAYRSGNLHSPERLERAAERILQGPASIAFETSADSVSSAAVDDQDA
ncbi:MAG: hypothetical protein AAF682_08920 [Planctomycetota bacterium]